MNRPLRTLALIALVVSFTCTGHALAQDAPEVDEPVSGTEASAPEAAAEAADEVPLPATVSLEIASTPPGAAISINGRRLGVTPTALQMPPGPVTVELELGGYIDWSDTVELGADGAELSIELEPADEEAPSP